jgi:hypothetical protein
MPETAEPRITIDRRFHGPPDSGNGGYVCGRLAAFLDGPVTVRLRVPPPLAEPLDVSITDTGVKLLHGETIVAEARSTRLELEVPAPPSTAEAKRASKSFRGWDEHVFPTCFVCGPDREAGDGLHIFAGALAGRDLVTCTWTPDASLEGRPGMTAPEFIWAALDCPGAFAFPQPDGRAVVLGELAVDIHAPVPIGECCVLTGWPIDHRGRKHHTGTALFSAAGERLALGLATWIEIGLPESPS